MSRVKRGVTAHAKHKKVYKAAKGYYGRRPHLKRVRWAIPPSKRPRPKGEPSVARREPARR